jgi:NADPH:quinone reductase-like Zn-dependent oxidoreductase
MFTRVKAIVCRRYGSPDVLELAEVEKPAVPDDGVLVRVRASSINPADWHSFTGTPYVARPAFGMLKPKSQLVGLDFAGTVESVGASVTQFRPGDDVFGGANGALAEYVTVPEDRAVVMKPAGLTFEEAAAVPVAAVTALQALRDHGGLEPGQHVLINGASGGVGTFAVQLAKSFGAGVTGVSSTGNVDIARSIGADRVIDYTREDFTRGEVRYDLIVDIAGSRSWSECRRVLQPKATVVVVGGPSSDNWLGPLSHVIRMRLGSMLGSQKVAFFVATLKKADLEFLRDLLESGKVKPVIDRRYALSEAAEAFRYLGKGHAKGKIVISV